MIKIELKQNNIPTEPGLYLCESEPQANGPSLYEVARVGTDWRNDHLAIKELKDLPLNKFGSIFPDAKWSDKLEID